MLDKRLKEIAEINKKINYINRQDELVSKKFGNLEYYLNPELGVAEQVKSVMDIALELIGDLNVEDNEKVNRSVDGLIEENITSKLKEAMENKSHEINIRHAQKMELLNERINLCKEYNKEYMPDNVYVFNQRIFHNSTKAMSELITLINKHDDLKIKKINSQIVFIGDREKLSNVMREDGKYLKSVAKKIKEGNEILKSSENIITHIFVKDELVEIDNIKLPKKKNNLNR